MDHRDRILDRLTRRACALQSQGRWEEADVLLSIASRYETLWKSLDANASAT